jgi:hypothetical protein
MAHLTVSQIILTITSKFPLLWLAWGTHHPEYWAGHLSMYSEHRRLTTVFIHPTLPLIALRALHPLPIPTFLGLEEEETGLQVLEAQCFLRLRLRR